MAAKMQEHQMKMQMAQQKAELDMQIKQAKFEQEQALRDAKTAMDLQKNNKFIDAEKKLPYLFQ